MLLKKAPDRIDIQKLEQFWLQYHEYQKLLPSLAAVDKQSIHYRNMKEIVDAITDLYTSFDEDLKTIVNMRYWDNSQACHEWEDIATNYLCHAIRCYVSGIIS